MDARFSIIENVSYDKVFQRLIKLNKGKSTYKTEIFQKRHMNSLRLSENNVKLDPENKNRWLVTAENGQNVYNVT